MPEKTNPSKSVSPDLVMDLVNSVLHAIDIDAKIVKGTFYEERIVGDSSDPEQLRNILHELSDLGELEPSSRVHFAGVVETEGRQIAILSTIYWRRDGTFRQEGIVPVEVSLASADEFKDESKWQRYLDWALKVAPMIMQIVEILLKGHGG